MYTYEQRAQQLALIQSIRESLPAGYSARRWNEEQVCIQYTPAVNPDGRQRWYVSDEQEWEALKPTLGRHSDEVMALLKEYGNRVGGDLSTYLVYGSPMRSMTHVWARIEGAVYMQADKASTGYHTYVATPLTLSKEVVDRFELVFVSR